MEKRPRSAWRYLVLTLLLIAVFGVYVLRLYDWQIVNGDTWYDIEITGFGSIEEMESGIGSYRP